jgi:hypothetical protein
MTTQYFVPQALVYQEFTSIPDGITAPLKAVIMGPNYQLITSAEQGALGEYDYGVDACYSWPNREAGAVVDQSQGRVRVMIDDALLQYFFAAASEDIKGTYCNPVDLYEGSSGYKNIIHGAVVFKTANGIDRDVRFKNRDVKLGDIVKLFAVVGVEEHTFWTYVAGFMSDKVAGVVNAATEDPNNVSQPLDSSSSLSPAVTVDKIGFPASSDDVSLFSTPANVPEFSYIDGVQEETYLFEVIQGGDYDETRFRITSASGKDNVAEWTPGDWDVAQGFGVRGLSMTFSRVGLDEFEVGMQWQAVVDFGAVDVDPVSGGSYEGPSDTTYIVTVSTGGQFGGAEGNPKITVTSSTGIDSSGPHEVPALDEEIEIGSYGVAIKFTSPAGIGQGLYAGDRYYVEVTAPSAGGVTALVLGHNVPDAMLGIVDGACTVAPALAVTLYIKKDIEVPQERSGFAPLLNWETSATEICLNSGILSYDSTWIDDDGTLLPLPVKSGSAWVMYRALRTAGAGVVGSLSDITKVEETLGTISADNPLAMCVYFALLNSSGTEVFYIGVSSDDVSGYTSALSKLTVRDNCYSLVPMTFDSAVQTLVIAHINSLSTPENGRWRRAMLSSPLVNPASVVTADDEGAAVLATISDDPETSGTQYTLVELASDVDLIEAGVKAGDVLRTLYTVDEFGNPTYSEYVVDAVLAADSLRLLTGPAAPVTVASKIEIWRTLATSQQAAAVATAGSSKANRRVTTVWPDYFEYGGGSAAGYFLAAAIAGLRSSAAPQRSLTKVVVNGPDSVNRTTELFSEDELNVIAAGGVLIVTQSPDGTIYVRHNLTTDMSDVKHREESITANLDSISYFLLETIAPFVGNSNLTQEVINQIKVELEDAIEYLKSNGTSDLVGDQLIDGTVTSIARHPTLADRLVVVCNLELPAPINHIELHLVV